MSYLSFLSEHGPTMLLGTVTTVKVLICSTILYVIISLIFGLMRLSKNPIIQGTATIYIEFFRGTSLLVQLFWFYYVLPFFGVSLEAFFAGVVALGLNFGAYGAEIVRGGILAVPKGQWEASRALGFKSGLILRKIILPQSIPIIVPPTGNQFIAMLKDSSLVSVLGIWELMYLAKTLGQRDFRHMEMLLTAAMIYWGLTIILEMIQARIERKYQQKT